MSLRIGRYRFVSILLVLFLCVFGLSMNPVRVSAGSGFAGGTGVIGDPYQISDVAQLDMVRFSLSSYFILNNDLDMSTQTSLGGTYYDSGAGWVPIGDSDTPFSGTFNGNNHTITGINISRGSESYVGLFGYVTGDISDLSVDGNIFGNAWVGGIAGKVSGGTLSTVNNYADIFVGNYYGGGVAGSVANDGEISSAENHGAIQAGGSNAWDLGGIVGAVDETSLVTQSYNYTTVSGWMYIGGIAGGIEGAISNCTNDGYISGDLAIGGIVGGGELSSTVDASTNNGDVKAFSDYVGGIVGGSSSAITGSVNNGLIQGDANYIGGIVGGSGTGGLIDNSFNFGDIEYTGESTGLLYIGGIAGVNQSIVRNVINFGDLSHGLVSGGVVGGNDADGVVINSANSGFIVLANYAGGVVGRNQGLVKNVYSLNTADGVGPSSVSEGSVIQGTIIGSIIGYNNGTLSDSYSLGISLNIVGEEGLDSDITNSNLHFMGDDWILYDEDETMLVENRLLVNRLNDTVDDMNDSLLGAVTYNSWFHINDFNYPFVMSSLSRIQYYSVIYFDNDATSGTVPVDYTIYLSDDIASILDNSDLAKTPLFFGGWNTLANGTGTKFVKDAHYTFDDSDLVLYASWRDSIPDTGTASNTNALLLSMGLVLTLISRKKEAYNRT